MCRWNLRREFADADIPLGREYATNLSPNVRRQRFVVVGYPEVLLQLVVQMG